MWWLAAIEGAKAAGSLVSSMQQADQQHAELRESLRRLRSTHTQALGQGEALAAASGVDVPTSSLGLHLSNMAEEFRRQEDWLASAGSAQENATRLAGLWGGAGDVGRGIFNVGQANNWWRQPQLNGGQG